MGQLQEFNPQYYGAFESSFGEGCGIKPVCPLQEPQTYLDRECKQVAYPCINKLKMTTCYKEVCVQIPKVRMVDNQACVNKHRVYNACLESAAQVAESINAPPPADPVYVAPEVVTPPPTQTKPDTTPIVTKSKLDTIFSGQNKGPIIAAASVLLLVIVIAIILIKRMSK